MKEIIYLDTDIMNSLLAQLEQGISSSFTQEKSNQLTESSTVTSYSEQKGEFGASALGLKGLSSSSDSESETSSKGFTEGQKDLMNKEFHDYSLNRLISKLKESELIKDNNLIEGDIIEVNGAFDFYDFSLINESADPQMWKEVMSWGDNQNRHLTDIEAKKAYEKIKEGKSLTKKEEAHQKEAISIHESNMQIEDIVDIMKKLDTFTNTANKLFKDLTLIKMDKLVGLLKKEFLRESTEALTFRGESRRKATFLGRVIGVKASITDGSSAMNFSPEQINKIPNMVLEMLLGSFDILTVGDVLISPIAVYYESN
ncbi:DUF6414 family protein [Oceanobacillus oncorhynchi]|uniref:DUF6414 family protein n=1 Tax=Oceanobacillus oncorhynchi TaxID=545501 RepID=UPI002F96C026